MSKCISKQDSEKHWWMWFFWNIRKMLRSLHTNNSVTPICFKNMNPMQAPLRSIQNDNLKVAHLQASGTLWYPEICQPQPAGALRACPSTYRDCFHYLFMVSGWEKPSQYLNTTDHSEICHCLKHAQEILIINNSLCLSLCLASRYQVLYTRNNGLKITKLQKFFALATVYHMFEIHSTFNIQSWHQFKNIYILFV